MAIDQRKWWHKGDSARREDVEAGCVEERAGGVFVGGEMLSKGDIESSLVDYFDADLAPLTTSERAAALEAAVHGYDLGHVYGQPSWLLAHAG